MPDFLHINQSTDQLINYVLHLADNALVLGQRNAEWTGHGPILEQDIAISNIALDLIGQARNFYQYASKLINESNGHNYGVQSPFPSPVGGGWVGASEDTLAYHRNAPDFKNCLLAELPRGDWAVTVLRQFFFSNYQFYLYQQMQNSEDATLAAIAEKSLKEVTYHLRWSAEWVIRLGDGTTESHRRITHALNDLWPYTGELTTNALYETVVDLSVIKNLWVEKTKEVLATATLSLPADVPMQTGGKEGRHTPHLPVLLQEMQILQRTYPGVEW